MSVCDLNTYLIQFSLIDFDLKSQTFPPTFANHISFTEESPSKWAMPPGNHYLDY